MLFQVNRSNYNELSIIWNMLQRDEFENKRKRIMERLFHIIALPDQQHVISAVELLEKVVIPCTTEPTTLAEIELWISQTKSHTKYRQIIRHLVRLSWALEKQKHPCTQHKN